MILSSIWLYLMPALRLWLKDTESALIGIWLETFCCCLQLLDFAGVAMLSLRNIQRTQMLQPTDYSSGDGYLRSYRHRVMRSE